ncbi:MAG TPA: zf-HC2 domain-containing protein [Acidobacteriaceae bacterium]
MDHSEAVRMMATERYLLGELSPDLREAFEGHLFVCEECAVDVRAGAALIEGMKAEFSAPALAGAAGRATTQRRAWFAWLRPAFAVPAFAVLLLVMGYQNLTLIPSLRSAARQPRITPWATLHVGTRDGAPVPVVADRNSGAALIIDVPDTAAYSSFAFALEDPQGKLFWTETLQASGSQTGEQPLSLVIPGVGLQPGPYTLTITGITPQGSRTQLDRRVLDIRFSTTLSGK